MKKIMMLLGMISLQSVQTKNFKVEPAKNFHVEPAVQVQEYVILRNGDAMLKVRVDAINARLHVIQQQYPHVYDALCAIVVVGNESIYCGENAHILEQHGLIDETRRLKHDVDTILDARILDQNSPNPSPYAWHHHHADE